LSLTVWQQAPGLPELLLLPVVVVVVLLLLLPRVLVTAAAAAVPAPDACCCQPVPPRLQVLPLSQPLLLSLPLPLPLLLVAPLLPLSQMLAAATSAGVPDPALLLVVFLPAPGSPMRLVNTSWLGASMAPGAV
jgi:hypothetical protein